MFKEIITAILIWAAIGALTATAIFVAAWFGWLQKLLEQFAAG